MEGDMLSSEERRFFSQVKQAIVTNPFSHERGDIDRDLAGAATGSPEEIFKRLTYRVSNLLETIDKKSRKNRTPVDAEDAELIRYGYLFKIFHQFIDEFDRHIEEQIHHGEDVVRVNFGPVVLRRLAASGLSAEESLQFLALFFQMRRAYFFIKAISGDSDCVQELRKSLWNNIFTDNIELYEHYLWNRMEDFSTLLLGDTGTGKGMAASAIGRSGFIPFNEKTQRFAESFSRSFISINLSQYPEALIESELFGHRKGAFTGAIDKHEGVFSRCSPYGAIFLDEIGEVSIPVQIKLLTVLEERRFFPVGSHRFEKFQGRIIAATNQPLGQLKKEGRFREDFYYRLCSDVIEVPPLSRRLQENPEELEVLLGFIIKRILGTLSEDLIDKVSGFIRANQPENYPWPGNIRELEQCTRQVLLRNAYSWQQDSLKSNWLNLLTEQEQPPVHQLLSDYCRHLYHKYGTYEQVARVTELDRRTVKKYIG